MYFPLLFLRRIEFLETRRTFYNLVSLPKNVRRSTAAALIKFLTHQYMKTCKNNGHGDLFLYSTQS